MAAVGALSCLHRIFESLFYQLRGSSVYLAVPLPRAGAESRCRLLQSADRYTACRRPLTHTLPFCAGELKEALQKAGAIRG
jgi:hypothetical protein